MFFLILTTADTTHTISNKAHTTIKPAACTINLAYYPSHPIHYTLIQHSTSNLVFYVSDLMACTSNSIELYWKIC